MPNQTPVWALPYPDLTDPADIEGVGSIDDLANRLEVVLSQLRASGSIPGEVKMWSGGALPALGTYGRWVWADGASYASATYPLAAGHIANEWRTFGGASDPGAGNFRVPDLRGVTPAGLDAMPGGARANRMVRAVAIILAGRTGEEVHTITIPEMPAHAHGVTDPKHAHNFPIGNVEGWGSNANNDNNYQFDGATRVSATGISIQSAGGGGAHENVQPTVFVPWIVKLDD